MSETPEDLLAQAALIEAKAKLVTAESQLTKTKTSTIDKVIIRGIIPIALTIAAPWATWYFSHQVDTVKTEVSSRVASLTSLVSAQEKAVERQRSAFQKIEAQKAAELQAMSNMVTRLDATLKTALVQLAVTRIISEAVSEKSDNRSDTWIPAKRDVVREATAQMELPGLQDQEFKQIVEQAYDRYAQTR